MKRQIASVAQQSH